MSRNDPITPATALGRGALRAGACTVAIAVGLTGCSNPLDMPLLSHADASAARLRSIDPIDLADFSGAPAETIEEASRDLDLEVLQLPEWPDEVELTLASVRADALRNNLELKVEVIDPSIAQTSVDEEAAKFESTFTSSIRRTKIDGPVAVATEGSQVTVDSASVGVDMPLQTGGMLSVDMPFTKTETNNPFSTLDPSYDVDFTLTLTQPLLRGAGIAVNTASILIAREQVRIVDAQTKLAAIRILAEVDRAYWRLFTARGELDIRLRQYEISLEQIERARRRFDAGDVPELEILRAQSGAGADLEAIIVAESATRQRQRTLKRLVNRPDLPQESRTRITLGTEPNPVYLDLDAQSLVSFAIQNRMEMLELELQIAVDTLNIRLARSDALPLLDADVSYNVNGLGGTANDAFDQLADKRFEDWIIGLRAEVPIGNDAAEARLERTVLQRVRTLATRTDRESTVEQEVLDALDRLEEAWQRIIAAELETRYTDETYLGEVRQFEAGERTSSDVNDALDQAADARSRRIRGIADYQIAKIDLAEASGTLLGLDRVQWTESP